MPSRYFVSALSLFPSRPKVPSRVPSCTRTPLPSSQHHLRDVYPIVPGWCSDGGGQVNRASSSLAREWAVQTGGQSREREWEPCQHEYPSVQRERSSEARVNERVGGKKISMSKIRLMWCGAAVKVVPNPFSNHDSSSRGGGRQKKKSKKSQWVQEVVRFMWSFKGPVWGLACVQNYGANLFVSVVIFKSFIKRGQIGRSIFIQGLLTNRPTMSVCGGQIRKS